jgi:hypothetical protein
MLCNECDMKYDDSRHHKYICNRNDLFVRLKFLEEPDPEMRRMIIGSSPIDDDKTVFENVWKLTLGKNESFSPITFSQYFREMMKTLPEQATFFVFSDLVLGTSCVRGLRLCGIEPSSVQTAWNDVALSLMEEYHVAEKAYHGDVTAKIQESKMVLVSHAESFKRYLACAVNSIRDECAVCGKNTSKKCAGCKEVHYCSRECQTKDWSKHKKVCTKF